MIKTVSFAPPRASGSRLSAKTSGAKLAPAEASRPDNSRSASGRTTAKTAKAPAQISLELLFDAPEAIAPSPIESAVGDEKANRKVEKTKAEKTKAEKTPAIPLQAVAPAETASGAIKAKRARVPKDLAEQYGGKVELRVVAPPAEIEIAKKRLSKVERAARRELIKPSPDLLERLARVNQIAARKPPGEPRGKGWKFVCGRCGITSFFETPGGLCACGTIAVKE